MTQNSSFSFLEPREHGKKIVTRQKIVSDWKNRTTQVRSIHKSRIPLVIHRFKISNVKLPIVAAKKTKNQQKDKDERVPS